MKSLVKLNRAGFCIWFVVAVVTALSFSGCPENEAMRRMRMELDELHRQLDQKETQVAVSRQTSTLPVTDEIIDVIKVKPNWSDVHYYLSKPILLRRVAENEDSSIEDHELHLSGSIQHSIVIITELDPGILQDTSFGNPLNITFENNPGKPVIPFRKQGFVASERYELTKNLDGYITYNGSEYTVEYIGDGVPYLLVVVVQELDG